MEITSDIQLALPKGRMFDKLAELFRAAGCPLTLDARSYRAALELDGFSTKLLKPQSIVEMLGAGRRDIGFSGADWVTELNADLVQLFDTELDPVSIVAAAPATILDGGQLPDRPLIVASEYARLTQLWMREKDIEGRFLRSWGATEVLPPEDADCIVDNTATGTTLRANGLRIVDTLMTSSTRLYASPRVLDVPAKRDRIEALVLLLESVTEARKRVMVEFNLDRTLLDVTMPLIPAMRIPTIAELADSAGCAIRAAVPKVQLATLLPALKKAGATDIVVSRIDQILA